MLFGKLSSSIGDQKIRKWLFLHQKTGSLNSSRIFNSWNIFWVSHRCARRFRWGEIDGIFFFNYLKKINIFVEAKWSIRIWMMCNQVSELYHGVAGQHKIKIMLAKNVWFPELLLEPMQ